MSSPRDPRRASYPGVKAELRKHLSVEWQTSLRLRKAVNMWAPSTVRAALAQMRKDGEIDSRLVPINRANIVNEYRNLQQEN
jgi:hypothetical protein